MTESRKFQSTTDIQKSADIQKIIDFHTHPYLSAAENSCMYQDDFKLTVQEARADLERAGITHICGSVIEVGGYSGITHLRQLNETALKLKELYGDFYTPGFHIHPGFVEDSLEIVEFMHENGYQLIGELVPYMHGWNERGLDYGSDELGKILELAGKYHMILSFHTMTEWGAETEHMIASHPDVTFVAAHPGERAQCMRHLELMETYENMYLDLSGTGIARYGMIREAVRRVGAERILFGTDYPIQNPGMYVEAVRFEHISEEERALIFYGNAERILNQK